MKKRIMVLISLLILLYDFYQVKYLFETKNRLEKELIMKSEKISEVVKNFIKSEFDKRYLALELYYGKIFAEFENDRHEEEEYAVYNEKMVRIAGSLDIDFEKYQSRLNAVKINKIKKMELFSNNEFVVIAGYYKGNVKAVRFSPPGEFDLIGNFERFSKMVMEKGDINELLVSENREFTLHSNEKNIRDIIKEIEIYNALNEYNEKYYLLIKYNMTNYNKTISKTVSDILFGIIISFITGVLLVLYYFIDLKYYRSLEYIKNKEKDILTGHLASGVAHEIRNPLNSINYTIEYINAMTNDNSIKENIRYIKDEIMRIERTLREFLEIRKEIPLNMELVNLTEIVNYVLTVMKKELEAEKIAVKFEAREESEIYGDRDKIIECLVNVMKNSIASMREQHEKHIKVEIHNKSITITDIGKGIPKEQLGMIFDLYYTTKESGSGIGLYRVKKIIEGHKGKVTVKSDIGRGTVVTIKFDGGKND